MGDLQLQILFVCLKGPTEVHSDVETVIAKLQKYFCLFVVNLIDVVDFFCEMRHG